jgi:hypothetical protein
MSRPDRSLVCQCRPPTNHEVAERQLDEMLRSEKGPCYYRYCLGASGFGDFDFCATTARSRDGISRPPEILSVRRFARLVSEFATQPVALSSAAQDPCTRTSRMVGSIRSSLSQDCNHYGGAHYLEVRIVKLAAVKLKQVSSAAHRIEKSKLHVYDHLKNHHSLWR